MSSSRKGTGGTSGPPKTDSLSPMPVTGKRKGTDLSDSTQKKQVVGDVSQRRVLRSQTQATLAPAISNGAYKSVKLNLREGIKNKSGLSPLNAARKYTRKAISAYQEHRLDDIVAKPLLELFKQGDGARVKGKSFVHSTHDTQRRPLSVFGVAENTQHDRGITPAVPKRSSNEDNSHGFPQSSVSNPFHTDKVHRMTAENYIGNQGSTREAETFMAKQSEALMKRGHIAKLRETVFDPKDTKTHSPTLVRDTVIRRSNSLNHIDVLYSHEHDNPDIDR